MAALGTDAIFIQADDICVKHVETVCVKNEHTINGVTATIDYNGAYCHRTQRHTMLDFISGFRSVVIGTLDENGFPFSSYAPFIYDEHRYYIFISDIARHALNLRRSGQASLFFIEDESVSANLFARKRVSLQCKTDIIPRNDIRFEARLQRFKTRFDPELIDTLMQMRDFNLHVLQPIAGEAVFGFGEAYTLGGEHMETLLPRRGGGHKKA